MTQRSTVTISPDAAQLILSIECFNRSFPGWHYTIHEDGEHASASIAPHGKGTDIGMLHHEDAGADPLEIGFHCKGKMKAHEALADVIKQAEEYDGNPDCNSVKMEELGK